MSNRNAIFSLCETSCEAQFKSDVTSLSLDYAYTKISGVFDPAPVWSIAAILDNSAAAVVVVRTRPRAIPLAMITKRKSIHGFPFLSYMSMGVCLGALRAAGAPLLHNDNDVKEVVWSQPSIT